jgi:type 1 glutamine amidotransferase
MRNRLHFALAYFIALALAAGIALNTHAQNARPKKIVFLPGPLDAGHPRGSHEYEKTARLFKECLDRSALAKELRTELHPRGWPDDPRTLDDADTIVLISNGADRKAEDHPILVGERLKTLAKQMKRGCGLVAIHWTVFVPEKNGGEQFLDWIGGYFDYERGKPQNGRAWYSKIQTVETSALPATLTHPVARGLKPFEVREEFYYNIRFRPADPRFVPILNTRIPGEADLQTVAWAVQRDDGGRGFGFTGGHFFDNWKQDEYRRMALNAIVWTAHGEVPKAGIDSAFPGEKDAKATTKALLVTGHNHPAHDWRQTTKAIQVTLTEDAGLKLVVAEDVELLAKKELHDFDVLVMNYCNWERPGLSDAAKANLLSYLNRGGGLSLIHFANGAFHFSLPKAEASDWPEWRTRICRRVWDHTPGKSGHDRLGKFTVQLKNPSHPITQGLKDFETTDELYFRQQGDEPITVLATAHSQFTGQDEPMAFVYDYGRARVFQTVLGHDAAALRSPGAAALIRRGTVWAAAK